ncbi:MAG: hypothetical protein LBR76_07720 [Oscillospiraceae bacterium]|jgi:hypothetical protein|nr:hypothetical protein [Oscillospiraceae bacterium]
MKKRVGCVLLAAALLCAAGASAAPGMTDDPLVTKRYIEDLYIPSIREKASLAVDARFSEAFAQAQALLDTIPAVPLNGRDAVARKALSRVNLFAGSPVKIQLAKGTILTVGMGASVRLLSGGAEHKTGVLADATAGQGAAGALAERHLYLCLDEEASLKATADASVMLSGGYRVTLPYVPLYTDLCEAMVKMGIVDTYELERESSRLEMMVIFLVLMGVRGESDTYAGTHPFTDVPVWADRNVAYLYNNGYIAGTGGDRLEPTRPSSVKQTCFLMLKALGYTDGADISFATATDDAVRLGLYSRRELDILSADEYTRDTLMYMTYYALFAGYKNGGRVLDRLTEKGLVDWSAAERAVAAVTRQRPV